MIYQNQFVSKFSLNIKSFKIKVKTRQVALLYNNSVDFTSSVVFYSGIFKFEINHRIRKTIQSGLLAYISIIYLMEKYSSPL